MSLTWSGAAAGASVAGRTVFTGPTDFTSALGSPAAASPEGAFTTETPRLVPPAGALITGAAEGTSVRGGSFTPVGVTGAVADVGRPAFTTETPRLVPPAGALITGAAEGTSVRGGSFTPVGVTGAVADVGRPAFTA